MLSCGEKLGMCHQHPKKNYKKLVREYHDEENERFIIESGRVEDDHDMI